MAKILVVDDEQVLVKGIKFNLEHEGYQVEVGYDGQTAVDLAREGAFDLILLDLMMPGLDGLQACMRIREFSAVPIIILTARGEDADKLMGFECGADDYITKPFNILELKARIRALLRRAGLSAQDKTPVIRCGDLFIDLIQSRASLKNEILELTTAEYRLLSLLVRNANRVVSRSRILDELWDSGGRFVDDNTLSVYIRRLREKVETDPSHPVHLSTVRGFGYQWNEVKP